MSITLDNMETIVPKHHIKGDVCTTRPTYREGRVPKAVKVYTVNNESQYILIQNVPSVGAKEELLKLCSSFGPLDDHQILDEYPTEDKYTEVYLIKYKRINSARFAKRKLDDRSFFGGTLHVCYAPEYESVQETRDKLQERQRIVARKIREHFGDTERLFNHAYQRKNYDSEILSQSHIDSSSVAQTSQKNTPASSISVLPSYEKERPKEFTQTIDLSDSSRLHQEALISSDNIHKEQRESMSTVSTPDSHTCFSVTPPVSFNIPLPPKPDPKGHMQRKVKYEFARVRSHHASLPSRFMETKATHGKSIDKDQNIVPSTCDIEAFEQKQNFPVNLSDNKGNSPIVVREYKVSKSTLKFVPRQTVKRNADDAGLSQQESENTVIKENAFLLGAVQGPSDVPARRPQKSKLKPGVEDSYRNTISDIRSKISKVISDNVKPH